MWLLFPCRSKCKLISRDVPGGPVVTSNAESASSIPGRGNKVPCATWLKNKQTKTQDLQNSQFQATHVMCSCPVPPRFPNIVILIQSESLGEAALGTWFLHLPASFPALPSFFLESLLRWHLGQCVRALGFPISSSMLCCHCRC